MQIRSIIVREIRDIHDSYIKENVSLEDENNIMIKTYARILCFVKVVEVKYDISSFSTCIKQFKQESVQVIENIFLQLIKHIYLFTYI